MNTTSQFLRAVKNWVLLFGIVWIGIVSVGVVSVGVASCHGEEINAGQPLIRPGDRVALLGGTLVESLQSHGDEEVAVLLEEPSWRIVFRNLGWSGDDVHGAARRVFGGPSEGYTRLWQDIEKAKPTVAILGYGFAEASNGPGGIASFAAGLERLVTDLEARSVRVILLLPFPLPGVKTPDYAAAIEGCRETGQQLARQRNLGVIDPAAGMREGMKEMGGAGFDSTGLRLSRDGQRELGWILASGLLGRPVAEVRRPTSRDRYEQLSARVAEKNALFFHHYRPMNETYLYLFRKHEQGNNAVEVDKFEPLVQQLEQALWAEAAQ